MEQITGRQLGGLLFGIHTHNEDDTKTLYYEEDILLLLEKIGLPKVEWGDFIRLSTFSLDPEERTRNEKKFKEENPGHAI